LRPPGSRWTPERKPLPRAHYAHDVGDWSPNITLTVASGEGRRGQAWDTLFWFAVLVGMSGQLNALGVIKHFADAVGGRLVAMHLGWPSVFALLNAVYFGLHYMFASQTAHVGALYAAFLAMMLAAGAVPACPNPTPYPTHYMFASQTAHMCAAVRGLPRHDAGRGCGPGMP